MRVRKYFVKILTPVCCACLLSNSSSTQKTFTFWTTSFPGSSLYLEVERGPWERGWDLSSYIFTVRPAFHTDTSRKRNCLKTPFKPEEFENTSFSMLGGLHENISKTMASRLQSNTNPIWSVIVALLNSSTVTLVKHLFPWNFKCLFHILIFNKPCS